jgi:hypothetical protein
MVRVLACLAEGLGIRATARVFAVDPNTVLHWLGEAAEQLRAFSAYFLCELHLEQVQLDELYAVLRTKAGEISDDEAITRPERSPSWVWMAMDPRASPVVDRQPHPSRRSVSCIRSPRCERRIVRRCADRWPQGLRHRVADPFCY